MFAQLEPPHIDWTDVLWNKAPLVAFFGVFLFLLVWYAPQIVKALVDTLVTTKETQTKLASSFEKLSDTQCEQTELISKVVNQNERIINMADSFRCKHQ